MGIFAELTVELAELVREACGVDCIAGDPMRAPAPPTAATGIPTVSNNAGVLDATWRITLHGVTTADGQAAQLLDRAEALVIALHEATNPFRFADGAATFVTVAAGDTLAYQVTATASLAI